MYNTYRKQGQYLVTELLYVCAWYVVGKSDALLGMCGIDYWGLIVPEVVVRTWNGCKNKAGSAAMFGASLVNMMVVEGRVIERHVVEILSVLWGR